MIGNTTHRFTRAGILALEVAEAPRVVTSDEIDEQLAETYERVGLRAGMLQGLAGIRERRWWGEGVSFVEGAAEAGGKAVSASGVAPEDIGLMVNTSVSRRQLEPSTAVSVHHAIGLPSSCQNFDVTNACLGFVNGMELAASMIDAGYVDYALVVDGEDARPVQEATLARLTEPDVTAEDVMSQFATLTLGSGAAAMVLGPRDVRPEAHRMVGSASRAGTEHHELCLGDNDGMRTDLRGLLEAGLDLSSALWEEADGEFDWQGGMDRYVIHQVSRVHTEALCSRLGIDPALVPTTFPERGNIGPVSVPFTLAHEAASLSPDERVLLMGIGSGLNASCLELVW